MKTRYELIGNYMSDFENENQEELIEAISEAGLHSCSHCGYITSNLVEFEHHDFNMVNKMFKEDAVLCKNCCDYLLSLNLITQIKDD